MKKLIILFLTISFFIIPNISYALSPVPTEEEALPTAKATSIKPSNRIDFIKNKVASRVAELNLVEKRGFIGTVESTGKNIITVNDINGNTRIIEVDELTKFSSDTSDKFDLSSIKKGTKIGATGLYNKESRKLLARFINEISIPIFVQGVISEKNKDDFTLKITNDENKTYIVDIENITRSFEFNDGDLNSSGFGDIEDMQNALIIGYPDKKEDGRITASKIVIFPNLPKNPRIKISTPTTEDTSPSSAPEKNNQ